MKDSSIWKVISHQPLLICLVFAFCKSGKKPNDIPAKPAAIRLNYVLINSKIAKNGHEMKIKT